MYMPGNVCWRFLLLLPELRVVLSDSNYTSHWTWVRWKNVSLEISSKWIKYIWSAELKWKHVWLGFVQWFRLYHFAVSQNDCLKTLQKQQTSFPIFSFCMIERLTAKLFRAGCRFFFPFYSFLAMLNFCCNLRGFGTHVNVIRVKTFNSFLCVEFEVEATWKGNTWRKEIGWYLKKLLVSKNEQQKAR